MSQRQRDLEGHITEHGLQVYEFAESVHYVTIKTGKLQLRMSEEALAKMLLKRSKDKHWRRNLQRKVRVRTDIKDMLTPGEWDKHFSLLEKKLRRM